MKPDQLYGLVYTNTGDMLRELDGWLADPVPNFPTEERDPFGFKYRIPFDVQVELFRFAIDRSEARIVPALCKEDHALWRALGLPFRGCHCPLDAGDALADDAPANVRPLRGEVAPSGQRVPVRRSELVQLRGRPTLP